MELQIKNLSKKFGAKQVLDGVSFTATSGRAFGLLGRNGAGKTTTIRLLLGVFPQDEGEILIDGKPIDHDKLKIGYLPEERGLYPKKKVKEQLVYFAELKGMKKKDAAKSVDFWLDRLEMSEYADKKLDTLSKGNQQKIQLVTALAHDPQVIVLDEPFSGLDPVNALLLKSVVREEIAKDKIVLFSSHQMGYVEEFCDDVAILSHGKIAVSGSLAEIKDGYPKNKLETTCANADKIVADFADNAQRIAPNKVLVQVNPSEIGTMMAMFTIRYSPDEIKIFKPSLEDIFVEYAGD